MHESEVAQLCPTPSDSMDCSLPAPPSMGFSRQEYWSGVPLPSLKLVLNTGLLKKDSKVKEIQCCVIFCSFHCRMTCYFNASK